MVYQNDDKYSGYWEDGKKHGEGIYLIPKHAVKLKGTWDSGFLKNGRWYMENGDYFEGNFKENYPYGDGVWVKANGREIKGRYEHEKNALSEDVFPMVKNEIYKVEPHKITTIWIPE